MYQIFTNVNIKVVLRLEVVIKIYDDVLEHSTMFKHKTDD